MSAVIEQQHGAVVVMKPEGPLIQEQAEALGHAALNKAQAMLGRLVVDLSNAPYIDSVGLETLLDLADVLEGCGQTLRLAAVSQTITEVLDLTGIISRFEYHDDANLAVRSFL